MLDPSESKYMVHSCDRYTKTDLCGKKKEFDSSTMILSVVSDRCASKRKKVAKYNLLIHVNLALFPGLKRRRRKGLVSAVRACTNRGGIPPPPHTIDILQYARDARIDTKRNTVRRFMVAKYGMQETHSIVLIQRTI